MKAKKKIKAAAPTRGRGRPPGPGFDPWALFRREVLRALRDIGTTPVLQGEAVSVTTKAGDQVGGFVIRSSILGIHVDTRGGRKSQSVYIPLGAIDTLDIAPRMVANAPELAGALIPTPMGPDDEPDDDPDLPPDAEDDNESAPDARVVP